MPTSRYSPTAESLDVRTGDGDSDTAQEALIPLLARQSVDGRPIEEMDDVPPRLGEKKRPNREARIFAAAAVTLVALMAYAIVRSISPARPNSSVPKTAVAIVQDLLDRLLPNATPATLADTFLQHSQSINVGVVPFSDLDYPPSYSPALLQHTLTTDGWSPACLEAFVARGELCADLVGKYERSKVATDVIWTWVNGSSAEILSDWMLQASRGNRQARSVRTAPKEQSLRHRGIGASVSRHFRDHDELRFSIRSVLASLSDENLSTLRVVVGDTPATLRDNTAPIESTSAIFSNISHSLHYAQIPHWVELASLHLAPNRSASSKPDAPPFLHIHPHSTFFRSPPPATINAADDAAAVNATAKWRDEVVPSFNSLAIESQLPNIDFTAKTALYLNDDFFLTRDLAITDFTSPLFGPVLRLQRDLMVTGVAPENTHDNPDGEWKGLGYSAWLLDERFGARGRPYLAHIAKVIPVPILKEVQQVFIQELTTRIQTASARFRGDQQTEVQLLFLITHYVVEKHREALLWSFFLARSDTDGSGTYSPSERQNLLAELNLSPKSPSTIVPPYRRTTLADLQRRSLEAGLPTPLLTSFPFSSADGYAYTNIHAPPGEAHNGKPIWPVLAEQSGRVDSICTLDFDRCFGPDFLSRPDKNNIAIDEVYRRVAYAQPDCGDCIIALLVGKSGPRGFEAFLPRPSDSHDSPPDEQPTEAVAIGLDSTKWQHVDLGMPVGDVRARRQQAVSLIQRYAYTLGDTPSYFYAVRAGGDGLSTRLDEITDPDREDRPALVALNDDVSSVRPSTLRDINDRLEDWFRKTWPVPSPWEAT
ncbi:hypothetical protein JCM10908_001655 [Rhodotorula pacifica]|uniref:uncharacterized protein n=1 Tax=Rhodotorula pacifica TaxID=1495444 RepID=UPI00316F1386